MEDSSLLLVGTVFLRTLLFLLLAVYINIQARRYGGLRNGDRYQYHSRPHSTLPQKIFLLDVVRDATQKRGWVRFFFWENLFVYATFIPVNVLCTIIERIKGQTNLTFALTFGFTLGFSVAHFAVFLICDDIFDKAD